MTHLRRYDVTTGPAWQDGGQGEMEESPKGEYVRWDDVAVLLQHLKVQDDEIAWLRSVLEQIAVARPHYGMPDEKLIERARMALREARWTSDEIQEVKAKAAETYKWLASEPAHSKNFPLGAGEGTAKDADTDPVRRSRMRRSSDQ